MRDEAAQLRAGLDERGVKWTSERVSDGVLFTFAKDSRTYSVFARDRAGFEIWSKYLTAEQIIAATLGPRTCKVDVLNTGDCAGYECSEYIMHCNCCGHEFGHVLYNEDGDVWMSEVPNFCPNCGTKVEDE